MLVSEWQWMFLGIFWCVVRKGWYNETWWVSHYHITFRLWECALRAWNAAFWRFLCSLLCCVCGAVARVNFFAHSCEFWWLVEVCFVGHLCNGCDAIFLVTCFELSLQLFVLGCLVFCVPACGRFDSNGGFLHVTSTINRMVGEYYRMESEQ